MARNLPEWIGKSDDTPVPPRVRLRVFERYNGICQLSKRKILIGEEWHCHHVVGLEEKGENRESNLVPALVEPHKRENARQQAVKKTVNRIRKKHIGISENKPWPKPPKESKRLAPRITKTFLPPRRLFE